jgi:signal transduction histidine kinase/CheY-like chemotaxis protein
MLLFACLVTAGIAVNHMPFTLHFRVDFLFGGIFALVAIYVLPPTAGICAAVLIALPTLQLWNHSLGLIMYTAEAVLITLLLRKTRMHLLMCATITWFFLLPPLIYLNMHLSGLFFQTAMRLFLLKYMINGVFNAAAATAIIFILKLRASGEQQNDTAIGASEAAINVFIIVTVIPLLVFTLFDSRIISNSVYSQIHSRHEELKKSLALQIKTWHDNHVNIIRMIATYAGKTDRPADISKAIEALCHNQGGLKFFHVIDMQGKRIACCPHHCKEEETCKVHDQILQTYNKIVSDTGKPLISGINRPELCATTPIVIIAEPVVSNGVLTGIAAGALDPISIEAMLDPLVGEKIQIKLVDRQNRVVYDRNHANIGKTYESPLDRAMTVMEGKLTIIPPTENLVASYRFRNSTILLNTDLTVPANWNMIIEEPMAEYVDTLFELSFSQFLNISALTLFLVIMSGFIRKYFSIPLRQISDYTSEIARTGFCNRSYPAPESSVFEIRRLLENFSAAMDRIVESQELEKEKNLQLQLANEELKASMLQLQKTRLVADQAEKSFAALINNSLFSILLADKKGRIEFANSEFTRNTGLNVSIGMDLKTLMHEFLPFGPLGFPLTSFLHKTTKGHPVRQIDSGELHLKRDGGKKVFHCVATEVEARYILIFSDTTEAAIVAEEKSRLAEQMQAAQKFESLGTLAGGVAHDFNNILMSIMGYAELTLAELPTPGKLHDNISMIQTAAKRAAELTRQMLDFTGKNVFNLAPVNLSELVKEMISLLAVAVSKKISVSYELCDNAIVLADQAQMRQIALNLILNASESIGENEGKITIHIDITNRQNEFIRSAMMANLDSETEHFALFTVTDTGCGIAPEMLSKIFDPFFTTKFTGRGLGLSATMGIIKSHRGAIHVSSKTGEGSCFRIFLPISDSKTVWEENVIEETPQIALQGKLLLADDEETILNITEMMLEPYNIELLCAQDGQSAVDLFQQNHENIGLVILDMIMPRLNGEEACKRIKAINPAVPIIIASGYSQNETIQKFGNVTFDGFLQKPFKIKDLIEQINAASRGSASRRGSASN